MRTGGPALLTNSRRPTISVAAIAKRKLKPGERIAKGIGSFDLRGETVRISHHPQHVPIGLVCDAVIRRRVDADQPLTMDDIDLPDNLATQSWLATIRSLRQAGDPDASRKEVNVS